MCRRRYRRGKKNINFPTAFARTNNNDSNNNNNNNINNNELEDKNNIQQEMESVCVFSLGLLHSFFHSHSLIGTK